MRHKEGTKERGQVVTHNDGRRIQTKVLTVTLGRTPAIGVCKVDGKRVVVVRRKFLSGKQHVPGVGVTAWASWSIVKEASR